MGTTINNITSSQVTLADACWHGVDRASVFGFKKHGMSVCPSKYEIYACLHECVSNRQFTRQYPKHLLLFTVKICFVLFVRTKSGFLLFAFHFIPPHFISCHLFYCVNILILFVNRRQPIAYTVYGCYQINDVCITEINKSNISKWTCNVQCNSMKLCS